MPRLIVSDLDGTLLRTDGTCSARTARAVEAVQSAGIAWIIATARPPRWMHGLLPVVGTGGVAVCSNGAFVYDVGRRVILDERPILRGVLDEIVGDLRRAIPDIGFAVEGRDGLFKEPHYDDIHRESDVGEVADVLDRTDPPGKLLARSVSQPAEAFLDRVVGVIGPRAVVSFSGATGLAEISAAGITKAAVMDELCRDRGIAPAEVWAFGDMPNDLAMLTWAGSSFAVANAHADVLAAADHIVPSNDEDGVASALEQLLAWRGGAASPGPQAVRRGEDRRIDHRRHDRRR